MKYRIVEDIKTVCTILEISYSELAIKLGVARSTIQRILKEELQPSDSLLEKFYSFAYENKFHPIRLNELKTQFAKDKYDKVLFHGAKKAITNEIDLKHSRKDIDVGVGFYLGESYSQASSYVYNHNDSLVYIFNVNKLGKLKVVEFSVSLEWMLMVSYFRGQLHEFKDSKIIKNIIEKANNCDVIIAPIANNNMFETMGQFARGEITDLQAISALSASHLGKQHVLKTELACKSIEMVDCLYLCKKEREDIEIIRRENAIIAEDKAKVVITSLRRQGKYIEELLK